MRKSQAPSALGIGSNVTAGVVPLLPLDLKILESLTRYQRSQKFACYYFLIFVVGLCLIMRFLKNLARMSSARASKDYATRRKCKDEFFFDIFPALDFLKSNRNIFDFWRGCKPVLGHPRGIAYSLVLLS
jgi:hypothetical protein